MNGAREFAGLFKTGQRGRLYLVISSHGRGRTLRIFVLPEGVKATRNGDCNAPLNSDAVEVYGVICGNPGWTESYGWLHSGRWQEDFAALVAARRAEIAAAVEAQKRAGKERDQKAAERVTALLSDY